MVLAGGEFAYGSVSMPIHALPSSSPKTKRRAVAGAMVIALVALCAVICTVFVSRMDSDHSLQQHGAFNPMIGDLASAKAKLASPDAVPLPSGPLINSQSSTLKLQPVTIAHSRRALCRRDGQSFSPARQAGTSCLVTQHRNPSCVGAAICRHSFSSLSCRDLDFSTVCCCKACQP